MWLLSEFKEYSNKFIFFIMSSFISQLRYETIMLKHQDYTNICRHVKTYTKRWYHFSLNASMCSAETVCVFLHSIQVHLLADFPSLNEIQVIKSILKYDNWNLTDSIIACLQIRFFLWYLRHSIVFAILFPGLFYVLKIGWLKPLHNENYKRKIFMSLWVYR